VFVPGRPPRFTDRQLRAAIAAARSWAEALRLLGYRSAGGNWKTIQKHAARLRLSTDHFDAHAASVAGLRRARFRAIPLEDVLVENSTYNRQNLKTRLLSNGLKDPRCELCGQGEIWRGKRLSLILDHINGVPNDHRLQNLRIVCPTCAATLDTHCGRKNRRPPRPCVLCGRDFYSKRPEQRYCSRECGQRVAWINRKSRRKVERPSYEQLLAEIEASNYRAVGRKYGVTDNTIRKWVRQYRRERNRRICRAGRLTGAVTIVRPDLTALRAQERQRQREPG
jgi:transposase-like protein